MARPLVALMHGDRKVPTRNPARQVGCKGIAPRVLVGLLRAQPAHCARSRCTTRAAGTLRAQPVHCALADGRARR